jgi:hypothetical protein
MPAFTRLTMKNASSACCALPLIFLGSCLAVFDASTASCQSPLPPQSSPSPPDISPLGFTENESSSTSPTEEGSAFGEGLTDQQRQQLDRWIEELGAAEFAIRERAAGNLMTLGKEVIPELRRLLDETNDPETRLRAEQIIKQLSEGDLQARIQDFLSGRDVGFPGWLVSQRFLGDSMPVRELFIEILRAHPDLLESLDGTSRDRALALEKLLPQVQAKLQTIRDDPNRADLFAMLLVTWDPNVPLSVLYENLVLRMTQRRVSSEIRRNAHLSGPYQYLLSRWIVRSSLSSREEALLVGMEMDLPATLQLAVVTLQEATQPDTIATSLQAISKFGNRDVVEAVVPLLDDTRMFGGPAIGDDPSRPQIRDLAMITIAMLHAVPLEELGMPRIALHEARGFILPDSVYPEDEDVEPSRKKARARIDQLLQQSGAAEGS